ncbi:DUF2487 family protein [Sporosarcina sp. HYO08]|uniref:DUF2487 family protein n=1 Tax=Sporosarcina sp. HYO08 TaxID=1759557 RepID=UPI000792CA52|nr:DUF2487 family protein [Sporosarcina sp. HYO08]KXH82013.1 hypothetical protein AU377_07105 [Sporosarcina sp. HYO08]
MNWTSKDMDTFLQQQQYIDTLIVPLLKIETNAAAMKNSASASEFLMQLVTFMEAQFKGRLMLLPPFTYTPSIDLVQIGETFSKDLQELPFKHIFYVTTDPAWTRIELAGEVLWVPSVPIESMDDALKMKVIEDQFRQLLPKLTEKWSGQ